jgi:hypothetical protein
VLLPPCFLAFVGEEADARDSNRRRVGGETGHAREIDALMQALRRQVPSIRLLRQGSIGTTIEINAAEVIPVRADPVKMSQWASVSGNTISSLGPI